jgi:hypothetical protein
VMTAEDLRERNPRQRAPELGYVTRHARTATEAWVRSFEQQDGSGTPSNWEPNTADGGATMPDLPGFLDRRRKP